MRNFWRIGLVLGLGVLSGRAAANAQVGGAAPNAQVGAADAGPQNGGNLNAGLPHPAKKDAEQNDLKTNKPTPPRRSAFFDRVTAVRKEIVPSPAASGARPGSTSAGSGVKPQSDPLHPQSTQAMQARNRAPDPHVSASSSWHQESEQPARPTAKNAVRSTKNTYYPALRPGRATNSNAAQARRRTRSPFGTMLTPGAGQTNAARNATVGRNATAVPATGQISAPARAPSFSAPAGRR